MGPPGTWPEMVWIGGGQGAGKSRLAWALSREYDLPLHRVDLWTYDHAARMGSCESLDDELARGAVSAAEAFLSTSRRRLELIIADVSERQLGPIPTIVEGPQLAPSLAEPLSEGSGVWLLPDPVRTHVAREERLAEKPGTADRARLEQLLARDALLVAWIRRDALRLGRPVIEVPASPDWIVVRETARTHLGEALGRGGRLVGSQLSEQRRLENQVAARQGRQWRDAVGLANAPHYPFACECGRSGCAATWRATPDEYEERAQDGSVFVAEHAPGVPQTERAPEIPDQRP